MMSRFTSIRRSPTRLPSNRKRCWSLHALEQRLMLAGDLSAVVPSTTGADIVSLGQPSQPVQCESTQRSIVFIDAKVEDSSVLADSLIANSELVLLDSDRDGIQQITQHLATRKGIESIHFVGHGEAGKIQLGNSELNSNSVRLNAAQVSKWSNSLSADADILIYGCETGAGSSGAALTELLARITGADVAASTNATGSVTGSDWDLERVVGIIDSPIAFQIPALQKYRYTLPITIRAAGVTNDETMLLQIDGNTVATFNNVGGDAYAGIFQDYTYDANGISPGQIRVALTNAQYDPGNNYDHNLRIDKISVDGVEYETESQAVFSSGTWKPEDGITPGFRESEFLHDDGYFQFAGGTSEGSTVVVTASGQDGRENFELQIDGQTVASYSAIGTSDQEYVYVSSTSVTPDQVRVAFTNDVYEPDQGIDYNLDVDKITIDGVTYETEAPDVFSTGSWKPEDGVVPGFRQSDTLNVDGYFQYASGNVSGSTVVVTARGDDGPENFELQVDQVTVASFEAIGTSLQDFIYTSTQNLSADQIRVVFTNDEYEPDFGIDYNLVVDKITIDGQVFETESPTVFSTGSWLPADGIVPGFRQSETLNASGYFQYDAVVTPPPPPLPSIRINAGGSDYTDADGNLWQADDFFVGGNTYSTTASIFQTEDDTLYQTERWANNLSYDIPVDDGTYSVNLHFAEIFFDDFGQRVFDVSIENQLIEDDLDIFERARNAFFPGDNNALIINAPQVVVTDGVLDLDMSASVNNAKLSAIEIVPISGPGVLLLPTDGSTVVSESGAADSYSLRLNTQPTAPVTVSFNTNNVQLNLSTSSLTFNASNWNVAQSVSISAVNDGSQEGTQIQAISHSVTSSDSQYNNISIPDLNVTIVDNDVVPIQYSQSTVASISNPTTAAWGPDGRLYVGSTTGVITVLTFNQNNQVTATDEITTLSGLTNNNILGISFNPYDSSDSPTIYVSHSQLFANGGSSFPETQLSPYSGQVSLLEGPNFDSLQPLVTGLPVSNHDHGINGLAFDNVGDLYIAVGGNTNAGVINSRIGGIPESPLSAAILKANISQANFDGNVDYELLPGFTPPPGLGFDAEDSQTWGDQVSVISGLDVGVFASGLRNPYDLVFTTDGFLYSTDNGPNNGFGAVSTGPDTQTSVTGAPDELNLLVEGGYYGHPNRARGADDAIQNVYFSPFQASTASYTAPITTVPSSTNGIDEYRSQVFGGQLNGQLIVQDYNSEAIFIELTSDGQTLVEAQTIAGIADGLDIVMGPGGALFGIDFVQDRITVATPIDPSVTTATAYDISLWRASASGGNAFTIGGVNFGDLSDTTVTIGGQAVQLTSVNGQRITGVLPAFLNPSGQLLDVVVTSNGSTSILEQAFLPLVGSAIYV